MWAIYALLASAFWGMSYVFHEQMYKHISVMTGIAVTLFVAGIVTGLTSMIVGTFARDITTIFSSSKVALIVLAAITVLIIAEIFIGFSIVHKNATVAGLIEISYPVFIVIFSYLLFRENHLNFATALGGALIFLGVGVIYAFNR